MKKISFLLLEIVLICLLSACGREREKVNQEQPDNLEPGGASVQREIYDWRTMPISMKDEVSVETTPYQVLKYIDFNQGMPKDVEFTGNASFKICGDNIVGTRFYGEYPNNGCYYMTLDSRTGEVFWKTSLFEEEERLDEAEGSLVILGEPSGKFASVGSMRFEGLTREEYVFGEMIFDSEEKSDKYRLRSYLLHFLNKQGEETRTLELIQGYELLHMVHEEEYLLYPGDFLLDAEGIAYIISTDDNKLCRINHDGNASIVVDYGEYGNAGIRNGTTSDGQIVFQANNKQDNAIDLFRIDEEGVQRIITQIPRQSFESFCLNNTGQCFYIAEGEFNFEKDRKIYRWDLKTGERTEVFDLWENGLGTNKWFVMNCNDEGELEILLNSETEKAMLLLDEKGTVSEKQLIFAGPDNAFFKSCAASYSRKHPGVFVQYRELLTEDDRERMKTELATGKGPDLMVLNEDELNLLWQKDILLDLSTLLQEETKHQIWTQVLNAGKKENALMGIGTRFYVSSLVTANETWEKDTWTVEEFLQVLKGKEQSENILASCSLPPREFINILLCDLNDTPFLDEQRGTCNFAGEEFIFLLKYLKKNDGVKAIPYVADKIRAVAEDNCTVATVYIEGIEDYSYCRYYTGNDSHIVGHPTSKKNGNIIQVYDFLAANNRTQDTELLSDFLEYTLSYETQRLSDNILRKDILRQCVDYDYDGRAILHQDGLGHVLYTKEDGTSYLEDYIQFVEDSCPYTLTLSHIKYIIMEELDTYFGSDADAETTAQLIQNRVELYLQEQGGFSG